MDQRFVSVFDNLLGYLVLTSKFSSEESNENVPSILRYERSHDWYIIVPSKWYQKGNKGRFVNKLWKKT